MTTEEVEIKAKMESEEAGVNTAIQVKKSFGVSPSQLKLTISN